MAFAVDKTTATDNGKTTTEPTGESVELAQPVILFRDNGSILSQVDPITAALVKSLIDQGNTDSEAIYRLVARSPIAVAESRLRTATAYYRTSAARLNRAADMLSMSKCGSFAELLRQKQTSS